MTVQEFFRLLPDLEELEGVRLRAMGAAVPDPDRTWDGSSAYATVERRVLSAADAEAALRDSEEALHEHVSQLFRRLHALCASVWSGDTAGSCAVLVELGDQHEEGGYYEKARSCFERALSLSLPLADKGPQIVALRRIGRLARNRGELSDALQHYRRSAELARYTGNLRDEVIAETGAGNVLAMQGCWSEAERRYRYALQRLQESPDPQQMQLQEAQLMNNLGVVLTRQERFEVAEEWFHRVAPRWPELDSQVDWAIYHRSYGLLRLRQGRTAEARDQFERALRYEIPPAIAATLASDLADCCVAEGLLTEARRLGRQAEEYAIAARSPYVLGYMYRGLGDIARAQGDPEGIVFYEAALEIARQKQYQLLEAETLLEYAVLRNSIDGGDEARSYVDRAIKILRRLGDVGQCARAEQLLETMPPPLEALGA